MERMERQQRGLIRTAMDNVVDFLDDVVKVKFEGTQVHEGNFVVVVVVVLLLVIQGHCRRRSCCVYRGCSVGRQGRLTFSQPPEPAAQLSEAGKVLHQEPRFGLGSAWLRWSVPSLLLALNRHGDSPRSLFLRPPASTSPEDWGCGSPWRRRTRSPGRLGLPVASAVEEIL